MVNVMLICNLFSIALDLWENALNMNKRLFYILLLAPFLSNAQPKPSPILDKVKAGVRKHLYLTMKDYSSYKPVQWGKLEQVRTSYYSTDRCEQLLDSIENIKKPYAQEYLGWELRRSATDIDLSKDSIYLDYIKILKPVQAKISPILDLMDREKKAFKTKLLGYKIYHSYRGKNSYGAYTLGSDTFILNTAFKVEGVEEEEEDEDQ